MKINFKNNKPTNIELDILYFPSFYTLAKQQSLFNTLYQSIDWHTEKIKLFGKIHTVPRLIAWYGDPNAHYQYSGVMHSPLAWLKELKNIKDDIEKKIRHNFNSVLANLYRDGNDSMGWHSDNEKALGKQPVIASLSLGGERTISFKHKINKQNYKLVLKSGSLLVMKGNTQDIFLHCIAMIPCPAQGMSSSTPNS